MSVHMQLDLSELHRDLLAMCSRVEDMIHRAVKLLWAPDLNEAQRIEQDDVDIDRWDVRIEDSCLKILALYQPVAIDLRRITTVMKVASELERVADLSVNIADRAKGLLATPAIQIPDQLKELADSAVDMLRRSIDSYVDLNSESARNVCEEDQVLDEMYKKVIEGLIAEMHSHPELLDSLLHLFSAVRQVERVADHATNIAEDVVYLVEGRIIRHARKLAAESK